MRIGDKVYVRGHIDEIRYDDTKRINCVIIRNDGGYFGTIQSEVIMADQSEPKTIRCPKCGRTDYIKDMKKDFGIKDSTYKYKCINCNTYIKDEPSTDLFDLMNRFETLCNEIKMQLRRSSAEIARTIREMQGKE